MTENYQLDLDESSLGNTFYRLRDLFRLGSSSGDQGYLTSMQNILGDMNVIDHDVHPNSPVRNRPAHLSGYELNIEDPSARILLSNLKEFFSNPDIAASTENLQSLRSILLGGDANEDNYDPRTLERTRSMEDLTPKDWSKTAERAAPAGPKKRWDRVPEVKPPAAKKDWGAKPSQDAPKVPAKDWGKKVSTGVRRPAPKVDRSRSWSRDR